MSLAPYVKILGRGPGRSRSLTQDEANEALTLILQGAAAPEAVGAMLMLLRMKGETAAEIAGFASAARGLVRGPNGLVGLDWPSYAAGRTRGAPWFLLAARLVAAAGHKVLVHGWNGAGTAALRAELPGADVVLAGSVAEAVTLLERHNIAYLSLESFAPEMHALLRLRDVFGLRSCINTVSRVMNPFGAPAAVQGVFHPPYRAIQAEAGGLLGLESLSVIKGGGGEFERHPGKPAEADGLRGGSLWSAVLPASIDDRARLAEGPDPATTLAGLWAGADDDIFAEGVVLGTAALAFETLGEADPMAKARATWAGRDKANRR
ncbi:MAG: glycosyl transferase family protein [Rhodobacteraceae bacterium]|nr:glycosyl transferase family protein [Paracoccaceae bacterium]